MSGRLLEAMCDRISLLDRCLRAPLIAQAERQAGWARLWDAALDYGEPSVIHPRGLHSTGRNSQMKRLEALILLNSNSPPCHPLTWILAGKALGQILAIFV